MHHGSICTVFFLVAMKEYKETLLKKNSLMGQQGNVLYSRQKCLAANSVFSTSYGLMYLEISLYRLVIHVVLWFISNVLRLFLLLN